MEAGDPTPWTKPDDLYVDPGEPLPPLGGPRRVRFNALFMDVHVQTLPADIDPQLMGMMVNWANTAPFKLPR